LIWDLSVCLFVGLFDLGFGILRQLGFGIGQLGFGIWYLVFGIQGQLVFGIWDSRLARILDWAAQIIGTW
jgi:hypothetical protein